MMNPITFTCTETLPLSPTEIAAWLLDLSSWTDFRGYGVLPGIRAAKFEVRTPGAVGSRIKVENTDGSSHVEEITEWDPGRRLRLVMGSFSPPLARLATSITETWEFERLVSGTKVTRAFCLYPRSIVSRPFLWLISRLLRRAIARHLRQIRERGAEGLPG